MVCSCFPWQPLLRKSSFVFSKPLIANKGDAPNSPSIPWVPHCLSVSTSWQRPGHKDDPISPGRVIYFFLLMLKAKAGCWHSLPWFLSPVTHKFPLCDFVCLIDPRRILRCLYKPSAGLNNQTCLNFLIHQSKSSSLSVAEEHTFRCEDCDELFQSKLDLRRHKKYACNAVSSLYETLNDEMKQEGLGDGQVYECKDCERMFPNKYRYWNIARPSWPAPLRYPCAGLSHNGECGTKVGAGWLRTAPGMYLLFLHRVKECQL